VERGERSKYRGETPRAKRSKRLPDKDPQELDRIAFEASPLSVRNPQCFYIHLFGTFVPSTDRAFTRSCFPRSPGVTHSHQSRSPGVTHSPQFVFGCPCGTFTFVLLCTSLHPIFGQPFSDLSALTSEWQAGPLEASPVASLAFRHVHGASPLTAPTTATNFFDSATVKLVPLKLGQKKRVQYALGATTAARALNSGLYNSQSLWDKCVPVVGESLDECFFGSWVFAKSETSEVSFCQVSKAFVAHVILRVQLSRVVSLKSCRTRRVPSLSFWSLFGM
jgi:hypothetical protein